MLIDCHSHTSKISKCCQISAEDAVVLAKQKGMDGMVLTNHYVKDYLQGKNAEDFVKEYIDEFYFTKECGDKIDFRVFFGIEVSMEMYPQVHLVVLGVRDEFLYEHPYLFKYSQKELYQIVKEAGGILIQAHPFRYGDHLMDIKYLDALEVNCHPLYGKSYAEKTIEIAKKGNLALTCGADFHNDTYRAKCGLYVPDNITDSIELSKYIMESPGLKICIQEPNDPDTYDYEYFR